jgi:hypothetical protein
VEVAYTMYIHVHVNADQNYVGIYNDHGSLQ